MKLIYTIFQITIETDSETSLFFKLCEVLLKLYFSIIFFFFVYPYETSSQSKLRDNAYNRKVTAHRFITMSAPILVAQETR